MRRRAAVGAARHVAAPWHVRCHSGAEVRCVVEPRQGAKGGYLSASHGLIIVYGCFIVVPRLRKSRCMTRIPRMRRRDFIGAGALAGLAAGTGVAGGAGRSLAATVGPAGRRTPGGRVRLSSNEKPLGISPAAEEALAEAIVLANRYPSAQYREFAATLAAAHPGTAAPTRGLRIAKQHQPLALAAAGASFRDEALVSSSRETNPGSREMVEAVLDELGLARLPTRI